ncbi:cytochrome P450 [Dendrothele bispora CBS 962.96]|uniref:Cytochrome P450 n=1 Tax=Dendrothele bispora (strain CBS 962.96) TaxID=1314807 RepID=A0A4S8MUL6_DENBC|nr:cytochrome P450 [Dendrothele bispora CBS 962.96]
MDELSALPYLDAFVREVLRLHAPVTFIARAAVKDDIILLKSQSSMLMAKHSQNCISDLSSVKKGQLIQIPIQSMNKDKKLWGEDAWEFKPERWGKEPESSTKFQVYGVIFLRSLVVLELVLAGGSPSSKHEMNLENRMKAILFTLIRAFEFDLAVPKEDVTFKRPLMVSLSRPMAKSHLPERRLPVTLTPVTRDN